MTTETVKVSIEQYANFLKAKAKLDALEAAGVDNWCGYGDAMEILDEMCGN